MRWWDESMFAVNTYEMLKNGKWFSLYFDGVPDLYNTKPPLTNWLQVFFVKIFGYNELSIRLPSALATGGTVILLFHFLSKQLNLFWAWGGSLILLTSYGFLHFHTGRTGDSDALLTFFTFCANLLFLQFVFTPSHRNKILFFLFITLAFSTKLYASLLFVPAYLFILIYKRLFKKFVFSWSFLVGSLLFVLSIGSLLYLRELDAPGYLREIFLKDAGRLTTVIENHQQYSLFYIDNFITERFSYWFIFAVLGIVLSFIAAKNRTKDILTFYLALLISYLTIIMISTTKLEWYDMPLYPYLSVIAFYPIYVLTQQIKIKEKPIKTVHQYLILLILVGYPFILMFTKAQGNSIKLGEMQLEANEIYLFEKIKEKQSLDGIKILHNNWKGSLLFYQYKLAEKEQTIELITNLNQIQPNDKILVSNSELKQKLQNNFKLTPINAKHSAELFLIESPLPQ